MGQTGSIDDFAADLVKNLMGYTTEVTNEIKKSARKIVNEAKKEVTENSPVSSGEYKKNWKTKTLEDSTNAIKLRVYQNKKPTLTHLLEAGHYSALTGGRTYAHPHIQPAEDRANAKFRAEVDRILRRKK